MASTKNAGDHPFDKATALPKKLREWRHTNQVKLSTAAEELGVSISTWGHWETGARFPKGKKLLELVDYTGIPLHQLICLNSEDCLQCNPQIAANGNGYKSVTISRKTT